MTLHPKSRAIFSQISPLGPIKKLLSNLDIKVDLSNNTNPFMGAMGSYPDALQIDLKQKYANIINQLNRPHETSSLHEVQPENILFTVGSSEGIDLLLRSFAEPNEGKILVTDPSFPAYEHWGLLHNLDVRKIPLQGKDYNDLHVADILKQDTQMLFLCQPNNPTATLLDQTIIEELCRSYNGLLIVDEAYIEFSDAVSLIHQVRNFKNLVVLRTLSKAWGLASVRCGAVIADPTVINTLRYIQIPFGFPEPSQNLVEERCDHPELMFQSWEKIRHERAYLVEKLSRLDSIEKILPSQANFILLILKDFDKTMAELKTNKIHVLDCSKSIPKGIRVTIGSRRENDTFLNAIQLTAPQSSP